MNKQIPSSDSINTTCPYCGVGCGIEVKVDAKAQKLADIKVKVLGDKTHPANFGKLCVKGSAAGETLSFDGRMLAPQFKGKTVSWSSALNTVAEKFTQVIAEHGPDAVAFYVSGQFLTEDYYVANKLMKGFIGSANIDTNSRLCMASAVVGYKRAFGVDAVPCSYEDLELADLVVIVGSNTAWAHPIIYQRIAAAKKQRPSMKIVVVDPRQTATCDIADLHLAIAPGSDANLFNGLLASLGQNEALDEAFINNHTEGFKEAFSHAQILQGDIHRVAKECGLEVTQLQTFYRWVREHQKMVTLYSQGVNQSSSGVDKSNAIINVHLATGRIGQVGMGPFSITGQPNAMGGREVGGLANQLAAHMDFSNSEDIHRVARFWKAANMAQSNGLKAVDMFNAVATGKIKAIWIMNTNPVVSMPNANFVRQALQRCEMVVVSDCMQHTDTTEVADVLLPALTWGEIDGTVTNSERTISRQRAFMAGPENARADWWMLCEVAKRMGFVDAFDYQNVAQIFREHAALSGYQNNGTRDFDISGLARLSDEQYQQLTPMQWPVNVENPLGTKRLFSDGKFFTPSGKARCIAITPQAPRYKTDAQFPFVLNTGRYRDQWHSMTRTGKTAKLMAHRDEMQVEIHPHDAAEKGVVDGQLLCLQGKTGDYRLIARAQVSAKQRRGELFVPMHWNRQFASAGNVDALIPAVVDGLSGQPEFKHAVVNVQPFKSAWQGVIFSRQALKLEGIAYWNKVSGKDFSRYEIAMEQGKEALSLHELQAHLPTLFGAQNPSSEWLSYLDANQQQLRMAQLVDGQLQAVAFIALESHTLDRNWLGSLFAEPLAAQQRRFLLAGRNSGAKETGPTVCSCFGVGLNTIIEAIVSQQLSSAEQIGQALKAGTNCGSCVPELTEIIAQQQAKIKELTSA
ncbi:nitrate reductase [Thiosulfatimonas sediminis]|uniref:Nitrate reductase n=1 Tax=Thiosulfatimonas sediminis TaxID=2675054 RepID=A0A6F8PVM8_9GAMM|nr:nitrate reductase [Thiosulfatimonas sediminis]BBP46193.1 nitrate reductase [Thiosulfatimonas sediminis]